MRVLFKDFLRGDRPWIMLSAGLFIYMLYDFFMHISRPGSAFESNPGMWLLFSLFSVITLIAVMYLISRLLDGVFKGVFVVKELAGLVAAVAFHIYLSGPLYNKLFWSSEVLHFRWNTAAMLILCVIYLFIRLVIFEGVRYLMKRFRKPAR